MPAPVVLFDLDGTLLDTSYLHALAWWRACRSSGELIPMARLHRLIGMGGDTLTETLFGRARPDLAEAEKQTFDGMFDEVTPLPGAAALLQAVDELGLQAVIASSTPPEHLARLLRILDADRWLADATAAGDVSRAKPEPDIFKVALERVGVAPDRGVVVGDTGWDIEAAGKLGVPAIALTCGGWSEAELRDAGAVEVYSYPADLLHHLADSALARLAGGR